MSNIDFSHMVTREMEVAQAAQLHAREVKAECQRRILAQLSFSTQQNIAQAAILHVAGGQGAGAAEAPQLSKADIQTISRMQSWIARMQEACRMLGADCAAGFLADDVWPPVPPDVAQLAQRF